MGLTFVTVAVLGLAVIVIVIVLNRAMQWRGQ